MITAAGFIASTSFAVFGWMQSESDAVQRSAMSPAAASTNPPLPPVGVVTVIGALAADTFPARSRARTEYLYAVFAVSPVSLYCVLAVVATAVPSRSTSYPLTPMLSVEAIQLRPTEVAVAPVLFRPAGTVGAWVSPVESVVP